MDQVVSDRSRLDAKREQLIAALGRGLIVVDADSRIVWLDDGTRRRVNGGLQALDMSTKPDASALDCSLSVAEITVEGEKTALCVIREAAGRAEPGFDLAAAIESVMADTSWFTRTIIEKVRALRQARTPAVSSAHDLDLLSERERDVLALICEGRSDAEMSAVLQLSHNTVRNHVAALYRKIRVNRRGAAIIWGRERGIMSLDALGANRRPRAPGRRRKDPQSY
jgi:DNA-binding CsgD family transcriptional regulator